jgi:hypothetical protein
MAAASGRTTDNLAVKRAVRGPADSADTCYIAIKVSMFGKRGVVPDQGIDLVRHTPGHHRSLV